MSRRSCESGGGESYPTLVGYFIDLFDAGMTMQQVCAIALGRPEYLDLDSVKQSSTPASSSNVGFVNAVYYNVVGAPPPQGAGDFYVGCC